MDVFEFDYRRMLTGLESRKAPLRQAFAVAATLAIAIPSFTRAFRRPSQRLADKLQVWCGLVLFGIILLYFAALGWTVLGSALAALPRSWNDSFAGVSHLFAATPIEPIKTILVTLTLLVAGTRLDLRAALATLATMLSCTSDYLTAGKRRSQIIGELARLLDHVDEQTAIEYRHVHLLTYSFGSVVALDALFPREADVNRRMDRVDSLITIGCPFDFIRTYWPHYFEARHAARPPRRWLNVYCELDIFGSNFLDESGLVAPRSSVARGVGLQDGRSKRPTHSISFGPSVEESGSLWDYTKLAGFRAHSVYWDRDSEHAIACFDPIVRYLWPATTRLSEHHSG